MIPQPSVPFYYEYEIIAMGLNPYDENVCSSREIKGCIFYTLKKDSQYELEHRRCQNVVELIAAFGKSSHFDGKYGLQESVATAIILGSLLSEVNRIFGDKFDVNRKDVRGEE